MAESCTRPIWFDPESDTVHVIDQRKLPRCLEFIELDSVDTVVYAIRELVVRGAPLIGVTGAYGVFVALRNAGRASADDVFLAEQAAAIKAARPTAVNLAWAVERTVQKAAGCAGNAERIAAAKSEAGAIAAEEVQNSRAIGYHGLSLIEPLARKKSGGPVQILTHCNAGSLACIEYGTATAPIYEAAAAGIDVHVWVDETRPLNQGSRLTAWELGRQGIAHTVISDNAGGHLMQHGLVDMVIVGTDRTTYTGDVANKIGTYLKALAAKDNRVPFYVALPSSTFDWKIRDGLAEIPIEQRDPDELRYMPGFSGNEEFLLTPAESPAANYAFDVTPARLVTGFITERGVCRADEDDIRRLFPEGQER
ncbi:MAG: S-methyl-5-thioribose-1-phosphate isomerase [Desulfosalsimonadaceae bacterium]